MITLPANVTETMKTLANSGFAVYAVGGCVRDALMGIVPKDWDLATNARLWNLEGLFPDAKIISEKYSVIRRDFPDSEDRADSTCLTKRPASHADIATFRKEGDYGDSRRPDWVAFVDTIEKDLQRRDFTINAIAYSYSGELVDPFGGMEDLLDKKIRCIGVPLNRFRENPIRMLRAARMAAEYGFWPDDQTISAMRALGDTLAKAGPDRIRTDFLRLIGGRYPSKGLQLLMDVNLLEPITDISKDAMASIARKNLQNLIQMIDNIPEGNPDSSETREGGTPDTTEQRLGRFYRCFGAELGKSAIFALNFDKKTRKRLESILREETEGTC